ncbi:MAG TPA: quinone oxidoreductase [Thermoanaerobaculia bacterium]|nr:quinone oxidoreductase [Thermoanaerobaculia bacterium]
MRAVRIAQPGGTDALRFEEIPRPEPKESEALVKIEAAGVNFLDVYHRTGSYKGSFPLTLGVEGAGTVAALGSGVHGLRVGDRVASIAMTGSYAEYALAPAEKLVPIPAGVSSSQAGAAILQGMTAQYLAFSTCPLAPGDKCLVHAAAGGIGRLLCQVAKLRGAFVIGTAGGRQKTAIAAQAGADEVIDYQAQDFEEEVKRITGGKGVRVVYDSVGKATFEKGLNCLERRGMMVLFGQSSGAVGPIDPQVLNAKGSIYLTRPSVFHYVAQREELVTRSEQVLGWVRDGLLKLSIFREFPLAEAGEAHRMLEGRQTSGKLLLIP